MTRTEIEAKVKGILANRLGIEPGGIHGTSRLAEDLGVDSFGAVELMFEIEEGFGLKIPDSDIMGVRCVDDVVRYIEGWLGQPAGSLLPK